MYVLPTSLRRFLIPSGTLRQIILARERGSARSPTRERRAGVSIRCVKARCQSPSPSSTRRDETTFGASGRSDLEAAGASTGASTRTFLGTRRAGGSLGGGVGVGFFGGRFGGGGWSRTSTDEGMVCSVALGPAALAVAAASSAKAASAARNLSLAISAVLAAFSAESASAAASERSAAASAAIAARSSSWSKSSPLSLNAPSCGVAPEVRVRTCHQGEGRERQPRPPGPLTSESIAFVNNEQASTKQKPTFSVWLPALFLRCLCARHKRVVERSFSFPIQRAVRDGVNNCFAVGKERPTAATPNPRALADAAPIGRCDRPRRCARRPARGSSTLVPMDLMPRAVAPAPRRQPLPAPGSRRFWLPVGPLCLTRSASRCAIIAGCRHSPLQS